MVNIAVVAVVSLHVVPMEVVYTLGGREAADAHGTYIREQQAGDGTPLRMASRSGDAARLMEAIVS